MARVFMSFVHEDKPIAEAVQNLIARELKLEKQVFLSADQSQVLAGDIWLDKIRAALEKCEVLVLMLSQRSLGRAWVNFEAGGVWLSKRPVIPVCFGNVSKGNLPQPYAGMQAANIPDDALYLLKSIHEHLNLPGPGPISPVLKKIAELAISGSQEKKSIWDNIAEALDPYDLLKSALLKWEDEVPRRKLPPA